MSEEEHHRIKTDFFAHQAQDMSGSPTQSAPLMVVFVVVGLGVLYGLFQLVVGLINADKMAAMKYVEVHLQKPTEKDGKATVGVQIDNFNPGRIKNITFKCTITDAAGATIGDTKAEIDAAVPAGDSRTFPAVSLGEIKGEPARMHAELVDLKYGPKPSLSPELTNQFIQASADKPADATKEFMDILKASPEFGPAYVGLGRCLAANSNYDQAIKAFEKAIRLDPDDENAHYNLGVVLFLKKQPDAARQQFDAAAKLEPDDPAVVESLQHLGVTPAAQQPGKAAKE